jgi:mannose-6-phosphate isomerase-like protein (cupin superfamily)
VVRDSDGGRGTRIGTAGKEETRGATVRGVSHVPVRAAPGDTMRTAILINRESCGVEGLAGGLMWVAPGGALGSPEHEMSHPFDKVFYVLSGGATCTSGGEAILVEAGDVLTVPADVCHHVTNGPDSVLQIFWCIATAWGAEGTESDDLECWEQVDHASGWHVAGGSVDG